MQILGHDGPPTSLWRENLISGAPLMRCPVRALQLEYEHNPKLAGEIDRYTSTYYPAYIAGHLIATGGVGDQPARYLDIINLVDSIEHQVEAKAMKIARDSAREGEA